MLHLNTHLYVQSQRRITPKLSDASQNGIFMYLIKSNPFSTRFSFCRVRDGDKNRMEQKPFYKTKQKSHQKRFDRDEDDYVRIWMEEQSICAYRRFDFMALY